MPPKYFMLSRKPVPVFYQCLSKETLSNVQSEHPWHSLGPFPCVLSLNIREKSLTGPSPIPPLRSCTEQWGHPSNLHFSKLDQSKVPSHSSQYRPSSSVTSCVALLWIAFRELHILLKLWGPEVHTALQVRLHQPLPCLHFAFIHQEGDFIIEW